MFYVIKDNNVFELGNSVNSAWEYPQEAQELVGVTLEQYNTEPDKYEIIDGKLVDISQTDKYKARILQEQNEERKEEIQKELDALDIKCIRAMREGGSDADGTPFIDKYQAQILTLREEYNLL